MDARSGGDLLGDVVGDGDALEDVPGDAQGDAKHKGDVLEDAPGDTSEGLGDVGGDVVGMWSLSDGVQAAHLSIL